MAELGHRHGPRYESAVKPLMAFCLILYFGESCLGLSQGIKSS